MLSCSDAVNGVDVPSSLPYFFVEVSSAFKGVFACFIIYLLYLNNFSTHMQGRGEEVGTTVQKLLLIL
jgi:hypothetical protein